MVADLSVEYGGLMLKNPVIAASAGITENTALIREAERHGAAAVVMKTLFEETFTRRNPSPCFKLIKRGSGPTASTTFYSFEQASPWGPERYAEEITRAREAVNIPVIASINCVNDGSWTRYARTLEEAGACAIELNRSCPFSTVVLGTGDVWTQDAAETLKLVKQAVSIPVFPKFTPQLSHPVSAARVLEAAGADGLVMFSRFTGLDIDIDTEKPILHGGFAGHGGSWALHYVLRWIAAAYPEVRTPISASGGVCQDDDVIKLILAGACTVQVCTSFYMEGFGVISNYLQNLERFMDRKGYGSAADFRGKACPVIVPPEDVDRSRKAVAYIDAEKCNRCGKCADACVHGAIHSRNGDFEIGECCTGCGLCVEIRRCGALSLQPYGG